MHKGLNKKAKCIISRYILSNYDVLRIVWMQIAILNDKILPYNELGPEYLDRGLFFGDGVYEVIRSYDGKIFALEDHFERFAASLKAIEITKVDMNQVRDKVIQAFEKAEIPNALIYFHITRGSEPRGHAGSDDLEPNFFLTVKELPDDAKMKAEGISVITYPDQRWKRCDIKSLNLLPLYRICCKAMQTILSINLS